MPPHRRRRLGSLISIVLAVVLAGAGGCASVDEDPVAVPISIAPETVPTSASTTSSVAPPPTAQVSPFEVCQVPSSGGGPGPGFDGTSPAFEVLETYDEDFPEEWAGWVFDQIADEPGFRVFVTGRVDFHDAELRSRLGDPGSAMVVEATDRSLGELEPLADRLRADLAPAENGFGATVRVGVSREADSGLPQTRIGLRVDRADEATMAEVADALDGRDRSLVCLTPRVGPVRSIGEQRQAGPGWRLLDETINGPVAVNLATTPEAYQALWTAARSGTEAPPVDFGTEVVVYAGSGTGGCTDLFLTDVTVGPDAVTVEVDRPWCGGGGERAVLLPHGYLLAVDRSRLPERFELRLDNRRGASAADPLPVDLGDVEAEVGRLGDPRLDITIVPTTDDRTWLVDGDTAGPSPQMLFRDVFEIIPDDVADGLADGVATSLMDPRLWSATVPVGTTGVTVAVRTCVDDDCTEPQTCQLDLTLDPFDHVATELILTGDDRCRFTPVDAGS